MGMTIDTSDWPLVRYVYDGPLAPREIEEYMRAQRALIERRESFATVVDLSQGRVPPASQRAAQAKFEKENHDAIARYCVGAGFCVPSSLMRGALTAISWIHKWPHPYKYCATLAEAEAYARARLRASGL